VSRAPAAGSRAELARLLGALPPDQHEPVIAPADAGYLLGGPVLDATSPRTAFVIVGCGGLAGAAVTAVLLRRGGRKSGRF
jgi:hypothetical protein